MACFQHTYEELKHITHSSPVPSSPAFSAYLWGIETRFPNPVQRPDSMFSAYLWGIETRLLRLCQIIRCKVFSIPMRNWNNATRIPFLVSSALVFSIPMRNWNCYTVFQGLICLKVFSIPMRNWNIGEVFTQPLFHFVFSIPMRNWNPIHRLRPIVLHRFSAYLWGIETGRRGRRQAAGKNVFSIPMRNWNLLDVVFRR